MANDSPRSWYEDPTSRHETRYWNGTRWTARVMDGGSTGYDPPPRPQPGAPTGKKPVRPASWRDWTGTAGGGRTAVSSLAGGALETAWTAPLVAGFVTSAVYLGWQSGWNAVEAGIIAGLLVWAVLAIALSQGVAGPSADSDSWDLAAIRLGELRARIADLAPKCGQCAGVDQACRAIASLDDDDFRRPGVRWASRMGYIALWESIHAAEEALILHMCQDELWQTVQNVRLRIDGASKEVSDRLKAVVDDIASYLDANQTSAGKSGTPPQGAPRAVPTDLGLPPVRTDSDARGRLRQVVAALNAFVDKRYGNLVRLRNLTLTALCLTELFAYVLLALAVSKAPNSQIVVTCLLFFVVAAVVGFLSRLLRLSTASDPVPDYGLEQARLLIVPVVSGLAGLGGVLLTSLLFSTGFSALVTASAARLNPGGGLPNLADVFDLTRNPAGLLFAIVFGYAPTLLQARLDPLVQSYKTAILSTDPAQDKVNPPS